MVYTLYPSQASLMELDHRSKEYIQSTLPLNNPPPTPSFGKIKEQITMLLPIKYQSLSFERQNNQFLKFSSSEQSEAEKLEIISQKNTITIIIPFESAQ